MWVLGRLRPGVSRAQVEADLDQIANQLAPLYPNVLDWKAKLHLSPPGRVGDALRKPVTGFGAVLMSLTAAGLLLACINLAGMLLARASDCYHEVGVRLAVGATRFQLLRQLMTESLPLAAAAGGFFASSLLLSLAISSAPGT
jgi:ABC-type antimicrobial peptide transport system permease subunit